MLTNSSINLFISSSFFKLDFLKIYSYLFSFHFIVFLFILYSFLLLIFYSFYLLVLSSILFMIINCIHYNVIYSYTIIHQYIPNENTPAHSITRPTPNRLLHLNAVNNQQQPRIFVQPLIHLNKIKTTAIQ